MHIQYQAHDEDNLLDPAELHETVTNDDSPYYLYLWNNQCARQVVVNSGIHYPDARWDPHYVSFTQCYGILLELGQPNGLQFGAFKVGSLEKHSPKKRYSRDTKLAIYPGTRIWVVAHRECDAPHTWYILASIAEHGGLLPSSFAATGTPFERTNNLWRDELADTEALGQ